MNGIVIKTTGSWYAVRTETGERVECRIKGKFRLEGIKATNPVAVGDNVEVENNSIVKIFSRKNYIIRKSTNLSRQSHVIAANIGHAYLFVTLVLPKTSAGFIDRFLCTAAAYQIPATIIFNKKDIYTNDETMGVDKMKKIYEKIGYECFFISSFEKKDVNSIKEKMKGKINMVAGHSGTGKSTFINAADSNLHLKTRALSEAHDKGMHTTAFSEMFQLSNGGFIIDTPGIKEFGIINIERNELYHFFPEIFKKSSECKFTSCLHVNEPQCAVTAAVKKDEIAVSRYNSYIGILTSGELVKKYTQLRR